eukprot:s1288_g25.t1
MWTKDSKWDGVKANLDPEQLSKLQDRNKLLDILENQGQQIVVVGDTSSGKSTTINFLLGYPFNFVAQGIGTRRPCVMTLTPDPDREKVLFRTKFQKNDFTREEDFTSLADVANLVRNVNDPRAHPEWFDCLNPDRELFRGQMPPMIRPDDAFDETPVQLFHKDIDCPMRLVDVPGLSRGNRLTTKIALSFIKPDNAVILVIGKELQVLIIAHHSLRLSLGNGYAAARVAQLRSIPQHGKINAALCAGADGSWDGENWREWL